MSRFTTWLGAFLIACVGGGVGSAFTTYFSHAREMDIKMVELGLGILKVDPKESSANPARDWAIKVVERYSDVEFSSADKKDLLQNPVNLSAHAVAEAQARALSIPLSSSFVRPCNDPAEPKEGEPLLLIAARNKAAYVQCKALHDALAKQLSSTHERYKKSAAD